MQYVPQVSHIWKGNAPLAMTWTATALLILSALALQEDALNARRAWRLHERRNSMGLPTDGSAFRDTTARFQYGYGDGAAASSSGYGLFRGSRFRDEDDNLSISSSNAGSNAGSNSAFRKTGAGSGLEEKEVGGAREGEGLRAGDRWGDGGSGGRSSGLDGGRGRGSVDFGPGYAKGSGGR